MAGSSWSAFAKTVLIPMTIALLIYIILFLGLLPLYRRYRSHLSRYSQYAPLSSSLAQQTNSLFEPYLIEPSKTLVQKVREALTSVIRRLLLSRIPATTVYGRSMRTSVGSLEDEEDGEAGLFDAESGEAMVGFDFQQDRSGRQGRQSGHRGFGDGTNSQVDDSARRLSRELEAGFRDDSGSEDSDEEVTAGRRTASRRASEVVR